MEKRYFKDLVKERVQNDPDFRETMLTKSVDLIIKGETEVGKAALRDYVNATVGFIQLEEKTGIPSKSLMRMLSPVGSPSLTNLANILSALQDSEGVDLAVSSTRRKTTRTLKRRIASKTTGRKSALATV